ncbi:hypothetical protein M8J77_004277 [Diaphorina citri]|nr:hypothetical protein M8J77_004277 [Diaphorina citri]
MFNIFQTVIQNLKLFAQEKKVSAQHDRSIQAVKEQVTAHALTSPLPEPEVQFKQEKKDSALEEKRPPTLILNTPGFYQLNRHGQDLLTSIFDHLGIARFKFSHTRAGNSLPDLQGVFDIDIGTNAFWHNFQYGCSPCRWTRLDAFFNTYSLGIEVGLRELLGSRWDISGNCAVVNASHNLESQLKTKYELDYLNVSAGVDYSQEKTQHNGLHCEALLRHQDYFLGYAWKGTLLQSEDCSAMHHEHKVSLGWTDIDYVVNFTSVANLKHHTFLLYQVINQKFDQGISIGLDEDSKQVTTELVLRWKLEDQARTSLKFKIASDNRVGVGFERMIHDEVKMTGAVGVSTTEWTVNCGLGFELEI